ncbi:hypothetical protein [Streptomyces sp. TRM68367]|nr:hypothetical protein [Streptomyces sp. TRM68367]MBC9725742.1 hypothetical protein [Streptomyces sp. TRM68367]
MSSKGGARYGADEPTSFGLQPPNPPTRVPREVASAAIANLELDKL